MKAGEKKEMYKDEKVKSFDTKLNTWVEDITLKITKYYEAVNTGSQVKKIVCKFLVSKTLDLYFIGCKRICTCPKVSVSREKVREREVNECRGDFCKYKIIDSLKYV